MISLVVGLVIGSILTLVFSTRVKKANQLQRDLDEAKLALLTQRQMLFKHFSQSAEILDKMASDFRVLYKHMSDNSNTFFTQEELAALESQLNKIEVKDTELAHTFAAPNEEEKDQFEEDDSIEKNK